MPLMGRFKKRLLLQLNIRKRITLPYKITTMQTPSKTTLYLLLLLLSALTLTSCTTLLNLFTDINDCNAPGCSNTARKGSAYCSYHDHRLMHDNLNQSFSKMQKQSRQRQLRKKVTL